MKHDSQKGRTDRVFQEVEGIRVWMAGLGTLRVVQSCGAKMGEDRGEDLQGEDVGQENGCFALCHCVPTQWVASSTPKKERPNTSSPIKSHFNILRLCFQPGQLVVVCRCAIYARVPHSFRLDPFRNARVTRAAPVAPLGFSHALQDLLVEDVRCLKDAKPR